MMWLRALRRRSRNDGFTWNKVGIPAAVFGLPVPIMHLWPNTRLAVNHPGQEPRSQAITQGPWGAGQPAFLPRHSDSRESGSGTTDQSAGEPKGRRGSGLPPRQFVVENDASPELCQAAQRTGGLRRMLPWHGASGKLSKRSAGRRCRRNLLRGKSTSGRQTGTVLQGWTFRPAGKPTFARGGLVPVSSRTLSTSGSIPRACSVPSRRLSVGGCLQSVARASVHSTLTDCRLFGVGVTAFSGGI